MKMKYFSLIETKLFHIHRIFKNGTREGLLGPLRDSWHLPEIMISIDDKD